MCWLSIRETASIVERSFEIRCLFEYNFVYVDEDNWGFAPFESCCKSFHSCYRFVSEGEKLEIEIFGSNIHA